MGVFIAKEKLSWRVLQLLDMRLSWTMECSGIMGEVRESCLLELW